MCPDLRTGLCLVFMLGGLAACGSGSSSDTWVKGAFPPAPASEGALSIHRPFWQEMLIVH